MDAKKHGVCLICGRERDHFGKKSRERDCTKCMVAEKDEREPGNNRIFLLFYFILFIHFFTKLSWKFFTLF